MCCCLVVAIFNAVFSFYLWLSHPDSFFLFLFFLFIFKASFVQPLVPWDCGQVKTCLYSWFIGTLWFPFCPVLCFFVMLIWSGGKFLIDYWLKAQSSDTVMLLSILYLDVYLIFSCSSFAANYPQTKAWWVHLFYSLHSVNKVAAGWCIKPEAFLDITWRRWTLY